MARSMSESTVTGVFMVFCPAEVWMPGMRRLQGLMPPAGQIAGDRVMADLRAAYAMITLRRCQSCVIRLSGRVSGLRTFQIPAVQ